MIEIRQVACSPTAALQSLTGMLHATTTDGVDVSAIDEGEGPTIIVVHPGGSDASSWAGVAGLLAAEFRVVRVIRGLYAVDSPPLPHSMGKDAAEVRAIAELLPRGVLVGHSSGAVAALEAALAAPELFDGLVLYEPPLATASLVAGEAAARARAEINAGDPVVAMEIHMTDVVRMPREIVFAMFQIPAVREEFARFAAGQVAEDEALDALGLGIERYRELDLPALLIEGDRSPAHLRERLADLAAVLPNVRSTVTLEDQGHIAHVEAPQLLADQIAEFTRALA